MNDDYVRLRKLTAAETTAAGSLLETPPKAVSKARREQARLIRRIGRRGDVGEILRAERAVLEYELENVGGEYKAADSSLRAAITDLDAALRNLEGVRDPARYRVYAEFAKTDRNRVGELPRDDARGFFRSHLTRLGNLERGRMGKDEREVLASRKFAIGMAQQRYIQLQENALGIKTGLDRGSDRGR